MTRSNNITWILLLALTLSSFLLAEQGGGKLAWLIVVLAGIKFVLVAWRFMELHKAALLWDVALLGLLGLILGITILLS